jgi:hypothetical protein
MVSGYYAAGIFFHGISIFDIYQETDRSLGIDQKEECNRTVGLREYLI